MRARFLHGAGAGLLRRAAAETAARQLPPSVRAQQSIPVRRAISGCGVSLGCFAARALTESLRPACRKTEPPRHPTIPLPQDEAAAGTVSQSQRFIAPSHTRKRAPAISKPDLGPRQACRRSRQICCGIRRSAKRCTSAPAVHRHDTTVRTIQPSCGSQNLRRARPQSRSGWVPAVQVPAGSATFGGSPAAARRASALGPRTRAAARIAAPHTLLARTAEILRPAWMPVAAINLALRCGASPNRRGTGAVPSVRAAG